MEKSTSRSRWQNKERRREILASRAELRQRQLTGAILSTWCVDVPSDDWPSLMHVNDFVSLQNYVFGVK